MTKRKLTNKTHTILITKPKLASNYIIQCSFQLPNLIGALTSHFKLHNYESDNIINIR